MKTGSFTPKPGDLFQWHYDFDNTPARSAEKVLMRFVNRWVPCTGTNLLIALTDTDIWWFNKGNFCYTIIADSYYLLAHRRNHTLHPRKIT